MRISDWSSDVCSSDLWYQMALNGRRDLSLAPSPRSGFEMCLLRMLAFRPAEDGAVSASAPAAQRKTGPAAARAALEGDAPAKRQEAATRPAVPSTPPPSAPDNTWRASWRETGCQAV